MTVFFDITKTIVENDDIFLMLPPSCNIFVLAIITGLALVLATEYC